MIIANVVKVAIAEFEAKMLALGQHLDTRQLTTTPKRGGLMGDPGRVYLSQSLRSSIFLSCSS